MLPSMIYQLTSVPTWASPYFFSPRTVGKNLTEIFFSVAHIFSSCSIV